MSYKRIKWALWKVCWEVQLDVALVKVCLPAMKSCIIYRNLVKETAQLLNAWHTGEAETDEVGRCPGAHWPAWPSPFCKL